MFYEFAALGAALCWVFASLLATDVARRIGGVAFNRLRVITAFFMLLVVTLWLGSLQQIGFEYYPILVVSGIVGLAVGDTALFTTFKRLGPRRAQILYTCNAPIAVILGMWWLNEQPGLWQFLGIVLVFGGVVIAIIWGKRPSQRHRWESVQGSLMVGVGIGLLCALAQAVGSLLVKPVLDAGADPIAVSTVRIGAAAAILVLMRALRISESAQIAITYKDVTLAALNSFIAIGIGVSLLMVAFSKGDVGIASVLSSVTPVLILPFLWITTKERPAWGAWLGATIAVVGTGIIIAA